MLHKTHKSKYFHNSIPKVIKTKIFYKYVTNLQSSLIFILPFFLIKQLNLVLSAVSHINLFGEVIKPTGSSKCNIINQFIYRSRFGVGGGDGRGFVHLRLP